MLRPHWRCGPAVAPEPTLFTRTGKGVRKRCAKVYAAPYKERESWPCPAPVHRLPRPGGTIASPCIVLHRLAPLRCTMRE
ncbi:hypothetical protein CNECB9_3740020 [Cupriavidus necator]|uniref:Uncharacterized protein n=1 Tax=Cupriavidus necator TaxID=106590 RepID=A0A1K0JQ71_CUPNE|nr:hypothetical protein CNECB9_3740020 [Cupriavidus necator]